MIDLSKLTNQTQNIVLAAREIMQRYQSGGITSEHFLLAMLEDENNISGKILRH